MTSEIENKERALILSQLDGTGSHRVMQLSNLLTEFVSRWSGYAAHEGLSTEDLVTHQAYEIIELGAKIMDQELLAISDHSSIEFRRAWDDFRKVIVAFRHEPDFDRVQEVCRCILVANDRASLFHLTSKKKCDVE